MIDGHVLTGRCCVKQMSVVVASLVTALRYFHKHSPLSLPYELPVALHTAAETHGRRISGCHQLIPGRALCLDHLPDRFLCLYFRVHHDQLFERYRLCLDSTAGAVVGPSLDLLFHPGLVGI